MKTDYMHLVLVIDHSGSMARQWEDVKGGYAAFLDKQRDVPGEATVGVVFFDHQYTRTHLRTPLADVSSEIPETIAPSGMTALYDAMGRAIDETGESLSTLPEDERPEQVVVVVYTDGQENASTVVSHADLKARIERQTNEYNWQFIFLADEPAAVDDASMLGINVNTTAQSDSYASTVSITSAKVAMFRSTKTAETLAYSDEERAALNQQ